MKRHLTKAVLAAALGMTGQAFAALPNTIFFEDFNSIALGPSVNERQGTPSFAYRTRVASDPTTNPIPNAFTTTGPAGWTVDNNFDNFGNVDLTNATGTPVFDQTVPPGDPPVVLFKLGQVGIVVGNAGWPNQGDPDNGVAEWEGWTFANKDFWVQVAGDQDRSGFVSGNGTIAVVDGDEFDDLGNGRGGGYMNSGLTTAPIPVSTSSIVLSFDSSWRAEAYDDVHSTLGTASNNQTAILWYTFDNGDQDFIDLWDSDAGHVSGGPLDPEPSRPASLTYKADAVNENLQYNVTVPAGATSVQFTFGYLNAANDWWWAIDNLAVSDGVNAPYWTEDFESVTLGPSVNERIDAVPTIPRVTTFNNDPATTPYPNAFSHAAPAGWSTDNSGIKPEAIGDNNIGVFEWEGWSFTTKEFWQPSQGTALNFTKGDGVIAVADSDEFDDFGRNPNNETPNPDYTRPMSTVLKTPVLDITGIAESALMLQFDSSWRAEGNQAAVVTVDFGGGEIEVLRWESAGASPFFHGDNLDETVLVSLGNPAGATQAQVAFKYLNGSNNWFWAIDNVAIGTIPEPASCALAAMAGLGLCLSRRRR
ncbi:MAG: hypothetical protein KF847_18605 [Pirellulales bacterium]|nr:hypothetical protein [Pirellulales bacterium]